jgi:hypothetical protein
MKTLMRTNRLWIAAGCGLFAVVFSLWAQVRKPGLWELTTTQTWQQSPFPAAAAGGTHTAQVCLTQEQIDKYGAITPHSPGCQITNVSKTASSMTADMICNGRMNGKGTLESTAIDGEHAKGKMHFVGTMRIGAESKPVEWTSESTSVFKGPDCGNVKAVAER